MTLCVIVCCRVVVYVVVCVVVCCSRCYLTSDVQKQMCFQCLRALRYTMVGHLEAILTMLGHLGTILGPPRVTPSTLEMVILHRRSMKNGFVCCPLVVLSQRVNKTFARRPQDEAKVYFWRTSHAKTQFMLDRKAILGHAGPSWDHLGTILGPPWGPASSLKMVISRWRSF